MAKLTLEQARRKIEREKAKQEAIKKKMEIEEKKTIFGENWREVEQQKIQHDIEVEIGGDDTPRIYDSKDLYDFFEPILFYNDPDNKRLNMDFKAFTESEAKYKFALDTINLELAKLNKKEKVDEQGNIIDEQGTIVGSELKEEQDSKLSVLAEDGSTEFDSNIPIDASDLDNNEQLIDSSKIDTPTARAKGKLNQIVATYLNRFVPIYNKHICTCCGVPKKLDDYYIVYNMTCSDRVDDKGNYHLWVCKECVQKLFAYYYSVVSNKNVELSMQYLCASLNLYWDVDLFYKSKQAFEDKGRAGTLVGSYISEINKSAVGMTFMDSPFLTDEQYNSASRVVSNNKNEAPYDWSQEDAKNKKTVIKMVGYDPFEHEPEEDKKILYRDFLNILDEGMENDFVKFQAGIQIVQSFYKIRRMNEKLSLMEKENASLKDQKDMADLKAKELKSITDFSRDNGFSERYANAKAKGENTLTGIMNKMNELKYEKAILNRYDIETSETIQQAADASVKAIFNQLGLSDSEVWKITQDQFDELVKLRKEVSELQEDLRVTKYKLAELNLQEKARLKDKQLGLEED